MKRSKFTASQIMDTLKRAELGLTVSEICRELGIRTPTFYKWRGKYGEMDVSRALKKIIEWRGEPLAIRCDNGPEYLGEVITQWTTCHGIALNCVQPEKPQQNA